MPRPDERAWLDRAPGTDVPVIRQPFDPSDDLPFWAVGRFDGDLLYDRDEADATGEVRNQAGGGADAEMTELLVEALRRSTPESSRPASSCVARCGARVPRRHSRLAPWRTS